ncbi:MAG: glutamine--fructose-6-phosphate transaminase (isomerizing) [Bdellovibrionales bacterium]|nr:glutamine--fructose-6-phosphate transaminase (isomerizing) [Bdellovibrionales bacterium]
MCGIIGCVGVTNSKQVLLEGLKTLEYRGYDSSGIAIFNKDNVNIVKAVGKLSQLQKKVNNQEMLGSHGIAHTRWATHGKVTEENAHPHIVGSISIVHNGIIENYRKLKTELLKDGVVFKSETDTEVIAHLLNNYYEKEKSLLQAVKKVKSVLQGSFALLVSSVKEPQTLVALKSGPPLLFARSNESYFFSSDSLAFQNYATEFFPLEDGDIIEVKKDKFSLLRDKNKNENKSKNENKNENENEIIDQKNLIWIKVSKDQYSLSKQSYKHFMLKEIFEQPQVSVQAISPYIDQVKMELLLPCKDLQQKIKKTKKIFIIACGTSFYAAMEAKYYIEKAAGVSVEVDTASEFRYRHTPIDQDDLVLLISQSGETADTLSVLRSLKEKEISVISLCNTKSSSIDRLSDFSYYMNAGVEVAVASTKAFVNSLIILNIFSEQIAKIKNKLTTTDEKDFVASMLSLPRLLGEVLDFSIAIKDKVEFLSKHKGFLFMGRGFSFPISMEGALKLKELVYLHAEAYSFGEMKHGPLALIDKNMLVIALVPKDEFYEKSLSNLEEVRSRGASIFGIGSYQDKELARLSTEHFFLPKITESFCWSLNPILASLPMQLLAYYFSDYLGHDVDQPRNLAKSVTVE